MGVVLDRAELLMQSKNYSGSGNWLDESGNGHDATLVNAPTFANGVFTLNGTTQYFEVPDDPNLDFGIGEAFTIMLAGRIPDLEPVTLQHLISKKAGGAAANQGYRMHNATTGVDLVVCQIADGVIQPGLFRTPSFTEGDAVVLVGVRNIVDDDLAAFADGVEGAGNPDTTTASLANALALRFGARADVAAEYYAGEIHAVAIWREALSDADIALLRAELDAVTRRVIRSPRYGITRVARR